VATKYDLEVWIQRSLHDLQGSATLVEVCEWIWRHHRSELEQSGDLFYTWQYDVRWAATRLRGSRLLKAAHDSPRGVWELS
jgi:hypothetical protein